MVPERKIFFPPLGFCTKSCTIQFNFGSNDTTNDGIELRTILRLHFREMAGSDLEVCLGCLTF